MRTENFDERQLHRKSGRSKKDKKGKNGYQADFIGNLGESLMTGRKEAEDRLPPGPSCPSSGSEFSLKQISVKYINVKYSRK